MKHPSKINPKSMENPPFWKPKSTQNRPWAAFGTPITKKTKKRPKSSNGAFIFWGRFWHFFRWFSDVFFECFFEGVFLGFWHFFGGPKGGKISKKWLENGLRFLTVFLSAPGMVFSWFLVDFEPDKTLKMGVSCRRNADFEKIGVEGGSWSQEGFLGGFWWSPGGVLGGKILQKRLRKRLEI